MNDFLTRQLKAISRVDLSTSALLSPPPLPSSPLLSHLLCPFSPARPVGAVAGGRLEEAGGEKDSGVGNSSL